MISKALTIVIGRVLDTAVGLMDEASLRRPAYKSRLFEFLFMLNKLAINLA